MNLIVVLFASKSTRVAFILTFNCPFSLMRSIVSLDDPGCTISLRVEPVLVLLIGFGGAIALI